MKKLEVCRLLGISLRTLERRMATGEIKFTRSGEGQYASVDFNPNDLQLTQPAAPEIAPETAIAATETAELKPADAAAPPEYLIELESMSTEALIAARSEWCKPDDPAHGVSTNQPAVGSRNMPSPINAKRYAEAGAILMKRGLVGARPIYIRRPYHVDQACQDHNSMVSSVGAPEQWEHLWKGKTL